MVPESELELELTARRSWVLTGMNPGSQEKPGHCWKCDPTGTRLNKEILNKTKPVLDTYTSNYVHVSSCF